ncbi:hypothetical protein [Streptomyces sp. NBC_00316]|uniref:hypothetical protein n=1 Tax=Streptomyces sp. NBC_00316 TaxID=2975710 RepID=UPI002E2A275E|nr:hypothetical protein [Streptomyces sp. NBC_00316]
MSPWTIVAVLGTVALPQLLRTRLPARQLRLWALSPLAVAAVVASMLLTQAWGTVLFALAVSSAFVVEAGRHNVMEDYEQRKELGLPPLMPKGDPYTRRLFDSAWLIQYRLRMRTHPLDGERPSE